MSIKLLKFHRAFTLAELMVVLAVMTVVIAAIAPVLTSRSNKLFSSEVWQSVSADDNGDIYADGINHSMIQELMIGVSPIDAEDIKKNYKPYAKLIIHPSDRVGGNKLQKAIEFYHNGIKQGYLAAVNENILLGGTYPNLASASIRNSAYGHNALNSLKTGKANTAVGYEALNSLTEGSYNTAIGVRAGSTTNGDGNVYIGYMSNANGHYNTIISNNTSVNANNVTAIGEHVSFGGDNNVAMGTYADASGTNNTVVGAYSVSKFNLSDNKTSNRENITAIGAMSCANLGTNAQNKTCIGQAGSSTNLNTAGTSAMNNNANQVFIGRGNSTYQSPAAVVVNSSNTATGTVQDLGDSSVVIYGNLIVRGQTYMYGRSPFSTTSNKDALMGYVLYKDVTGNHKPYVGFDGNGGAIQVVGMGGYIHQIYGGRESCICTYTGSDTFNYLEHDSGESVYNSPGKQAYDWTAGFDWPYRFARESQEGYGYYYSSNSPDYDPTSNPNIELSQAHGLYIYGRSSSASSCCPILTNSGLRWLMTSDARLKNIDSEYKKGLSDISKLKSYNYTFKSDALKTPQVGVIAQDLKTIFANSVSKDKKGYYQIRWDEMFYSAINSIKELNAKIVSFALRVQRDLERVAKLKKENKNLENKLIKLAKEIEKLEHQEK